MTRWPSLLLLLALLLCVTPAFSRTMGVQTGSGEEATCPEEAAGAASDEAADKPVAKRSSSTAPAKQKPVAPYRGGGTSPARAPRWHRFLPGMFR